VTDPSKAFDIVELNDSFAYQLPMWAEGAGLIETGTGGAWIDAGGMDEKNVNLSGGMLNGNPVMLGGLARALECVLQLRGEAEDRQVEGAEKALAHGTTGPAGQHHAVVILEK
jgi:acetyl-CoA C-acetyltransferase